MSGQGCGKYGRPEEIRQMEATRRESPTNEIGGKKFEPATSELEMRLIAIENMKVGFKTEINGIRVEKITDKDVIAQVASEKTSGKYYRKAINPKDQDKVDKYYQAQGEIGEYQVKCLIAQQLEMEIVEFNQTKHGIDIIAKDKDGNFAIIEAKMSQGKDGPSSLSINKNEIQQMSKIWIESCLSNMQKSGNELYSETNAEIAREIDADLSNISRYVIHTNPDTLNMIVSEADSNGNWQYHSAYRSFEK
jgi:Holliday junction resolvase-like predicted endonuclease